MPSLTTVVTTLVLESLYENNIDPFAELRTAIVNGALSNTTRILLPLGLNLIATM